MKNIFPKKDINSILMVFFVVFFYVLCYQIAHYLYWPFLGDYCFSVVIYFTTSAPLFQQHSHRLQGCLPSQQLNLRHFYKLKHRMLSKLPF